ncbi:hypothetical protein ACFQVD_34395 [Streptosporangium amethystogenes subsp. fukuiense]|uniref:Uncharacterized protein n=1 Tax=Streptosporangium amethystogenes subsp. fukuiense TaxID=698418 RepID=A0ABW2TAV0_9ACTN
MQQLDQRVRPHVDVMNRAGESPHRQQRDDGQEDREQYVGGESPARRTGGSRFRPQYVLHIPSPKPSFVCCHRHIVAFA